MNPSWKIWVDTGGTFTDCLALDSNGNFKRIKILSNSVIKGKGTVLANKMAVMATVHWPVSTDVFEGFTILITSDKKTHARKIKSVDLSKSIIYLDKPIPEKISEAIFEITSHEEVPVLAARLLTETSLKSAFPTIEMKLGSTRGTNALLERKGAPSVLVVTKGFKDLLLIGNQQRPDLFALEIKKQKPLYKYVFEVDERIESNGDVLKPLWQDEIKRVINLVLKVKVDSVAIALLNSYKNPHHELALEAALTSAGITYISASHKLSSQIKIVPRAETTVVNAYLSPVINQYLKNIQQTLTGASLKIMTSAGGLVNARSYFPKDSLLSGPAGGVVGAATVGKLSNIDKLITFDMGGTSTDVSLFNQRYDYRFESKVGDVKILSPSLAIETIAAGGGSICDFDGQRLTVGPHSAGAYPGPACYGSGGPLTITDVNLLLGRIDPTLFSIPLYVNKAQQAFDSLLEKIKKVKKKTYQPQQLLQSIIQIANEKMAEAVKKVSVSNGYKTADFTLLSFGGAGGQHACQLAHMLGIRQILIPYDAGLLSAYGIGHARIEHFEEKLILKPLPQLKEIVEKEFENLANKGRRKLMQDGYASSAIRIEKKLLYVRFKGQESSIEIEYQAASNVAALFRKKYKAVFGHWLESRAIEVEAIKIILSIEGYQGKKETKKTHNYSPSSQKQILHYTKNRFRKIPVYQWELLRQGAIINGPSVVVSNNSTTVVEEGWSFFLDRNNNAILKPLHRKARSVGKHSEEASLELFSNRFTSVAQEMGALLQRTSFSVNVKERLDFSCAVLDATGHLVVNAPHIPVHLGSLGVCVREVSKIIKMEKGDVVITNHPAYGGSHLPDVTLIKPVFYQSTLVGYVANRAHHAEIGGVTPGSMPAHATKLEEEGVIIAPVYFVKNGTPRWNEMKNIFTSANYPTRSIEENMADLNGALASVNAGEKALMELCEKYGKEEVVSYMVRLRKYASTLLSEKIKTVSQKHFTAIEWLDNGAKLQANIHIQSNRMTFNFKGTASVQPGNLNATKAIVQSVVLYVLRLWVNQPIAMNEGLMEPVKINLPPCLLNPDFTKISPAVVGGNTEVSQRLTDTLIKALQLMACSQGTMNNFLFGNSSLGYYETIGGGTGAGAGFAGADAVHSHMTNTRITDPEILEYHYPVRLSRFEIRKNSGGKGKWNGGNGIIREVFFKEEMEVNLLSQHRKEKPFGLKGGGDGKPGVQFLICKNGTKKRLKGMDTITVMAGDSIRIETPGGGGWGK